MKEREKFLLSYIFNYTYTIVSKNELFDAISKPAYNTTNCINDT